MRLLLCLLLSVVGTRAQTTEIRSLPWKLAHQGKPAQIFDGYATTETEPGAFEAVLVLPDQRRIRLPYFPTFEAFQAGVPLVGASVWQEGNRVQVHVRTASEDLLRQTHLEVRSVVGNTPVWRAFWSTAPSGTILQLKRWGDSVWAYQLGGPGTGGARAGTYSSAPVATPHFLIPGAIPFSWQAQPTFVSPGNGIDNLEDPAFVRVLVDSDNLQWSVLSQLGLHPRQAWDLALIANPSFRRELLQALSPEASLGVLYRSLGALGPASQTIMHASPEALSWWRRTNRVSDVRRELLAGAWLAVGYHGLPALEPGDSALGKLQWDRLVSGRLTSGDALSQAIRDALGTDPAALLPVSMGRKGEVYYQTFLDMGHPSSPPFLWVDFWAPETYHSQQPEETIELKFGNASLIEALENLPWFGPASPAH